MTTKEAFEKLLESPELITKLKSNLSTIRTWRQRFKAGKLPVEKMEQILLKAGATKKPEVWTLIPTSKKVNKP